LEVPRRMLAPLAAVLSDLLFDGHECCSYRTAGCQSGHLSDLQQAHLGSNGRSFAFEFIAVPALAPEQAPSRPGGTASGRHDNGRRAVAALHRSIHSKGGAGLELDLAAARHLDRLPYELRAELPHCGLVNFSEAQAVVRKLEALAADPAIRAESA